MWHKVDPRWFRVWVIKSRSSERYAKNKAQNVHFFVLDIQLRNYIENKLKRAGIAKIVVRMTEKDGEIIIFSAKPATILWKDGAKVKQLEENIAQTFHKSFKITIKEVKIPELSAKIMWEFIATQLEARMPFRRVAKQVLQKVMEKWAKWVKIAIWGRLWWADLSRTEKFNDGRAPLQTIRSDIDYHHTEAMTKYWILGIKVRICKWEVYGKINTWVKQEKSKSEILSKASTWFIPKKFIKPTSSIQKNDWNETPLPSKKEPQKTTTTVKSTTTKKTTKTTTKKSTDTTS
jgi:small subunit ribosomal protein S3